MSVLLATSCANPLPELPSEGASTSSQEPGSSDGGHSTTVGTSNADETSATEDTGPSFEPVCGDGIVESPEECDLGELNGSGMYCTEGCTTNTCGDGYVGPGEACDDGNGSNEDLCTTKCGPTSCGDGVVQGSEECDDGGKNAPDAACLPSCVAASCGDTFIHEGVETCDGSNVSGQTCATQGFDDGVLVCLSDCSGYDTDDCLACGNGLIESGENCDGTAFADDATCESFAPGGSTASGGQLACINQCTEIDSSACTFCGDGMREAPEVCDGNQLNGATCMTQGFVGGNLACANNCMSYNTSGCNNCGNSVVNGSEDCDGAAIGVGTCMTELGGNYAGPLDCNDDCTYDTDGCCLINDVPCTVGSDCCTGNCTVHMGTLQCRPA